MEFKYQTIIIEIIKIIEISWLKLNRILTALRKKWI